MTNARTIDTRWARRKLDRARYHLAQLESATAAWLDPVTHSLDVALSEDGGAIEARLTFRDPPPLEEWALVVGDCAHNVRTALDVFVWANSILLPETQRGRAAYPILSRGPDEDEDDDEQLPHRLENQSSSVRKSVIAKVAGLPEPLRSRVVGNMRWASLRHQGDLIWHQRLPLIKELDDIDKHRLALTLEATQNSATWDIRATDSVGHRIPVTITWGSRGDIPTRAGEPAVVVSGTPQRPVTSLAGTCTIALGLRVRLFDLSLDVHDFLEESIEDVDGLLDELAIQSFHRPTTRPGSDRRMSDRHSRSDGVTLVDHDPS